MQFKKLSFGIVIAISVTSLILVIATSGLLAAPQTSPLSLPTLTPSSETLPSSEPIETATPQSPSTTPTPTTSSQQSSSSTTSITTINLGIYSDVGCTVPLTSFSWGNVTPGTQVTRTVYLKNTGNAAESLSMSTASWSPSSASNYLTITWSPASSTLNAGASTSANLTLTATLGASALTTFDVDIIFTGTQ